jgi:hypothetical protein
MRQYVILAGLLMAVPLAAQSLNLNYSGLAEKAKSKVELNLDQAALGLARAASSDLKKFGDVTGLAVHVYEYEKAGEYPQGTLDAILKQMAGNKDWSRIVSARETGESVDIYIHTQGGKVAGFLLIAAEEKEVAIVEATGSVELARMQEVVESAIKFDMAALQAGK